MGFYDAIRIGASGATGATGFTVDRSLRFHDHNGVQRIPSSSSNRRTFTFSAWFKISGGIGNNGQKNLIRCQAGGGHALRINQSDEIMFFIHNGSSFVANVITRRRFRDPTAWMHIVLAVDTTQSTSSNRVKIYINGSQETDLTTTTYPSQNYETAFNQNVEHNIGARPQVEDEEFSGYMTEINFIDGQALTPSSFGETDATTGQWNPIDTSGLTFGTNGFRLKFADNSGTTATTLGKDSSGNGNNFTPNNFAVIDAVKDSPTNNFSTWNAVAENFMAAGSVSFSEGNLKIVESSGGYGTFCKNTFEMKTGKWYWEILAKNINTYSSIGLTNKDGRSYNQGVGMYYFASGHKNSQTTVVGYSTYGNTYSNGDIIGIAFDADNESVTFYKNNSSQGAIGSVLTQANGGYFASAGDDATANATTLIANFGQDSSFIGEKTTQGNTDGNGQGDFYYAPPSGYLALCSANLPDPTILLPNKHFDTLLWTGDGGTQNITGLEYQPDWVWIKRRNAAVSSRLIDSVRGSDKQLISNLTDSEQTSNYFQSFNSDGFTLTGNHTPFNRSGGTYVAWNWNAGDTDGKTYTVKVVSDGGNKYRFDDFGTSAVTLDLAEGGTYIFDGSDSSMASHPIKLSETSNGTHGGGSSYNTGVTYLLDGASVTESAYVSGYSSATTRQLKIVVAASAPTLYYYCHYHSGMGGQVNTNSTLGSSNFDGSIQATVKVNATAGFSIVSYTGTGSALTVGHGLGVAPDVLIVKNREEASSWRVFHHKNTSAPETEYLALDNTNATFDRNDWNDTLPTSTVFSVGPQGAVNNNNIDYIGYIFSEVAGYSKFGSYVGSGSSSDGTFVFLGFRPAWIMMKETSSTSRWSIYDNKRNPNNPNTTYLRAQATNGDTVSSANAVDFLSNGFKMRTGSEPNASQTYVFFAFAKSPLKYARAG